ncbi:PAS domain-containing protein [Crocinitomicaceae bacterium]|nr:PAS domain-containing protein [Crocinitomicaceae bacterium]
MRKYRFGLLGGIIFCTCTCIFLLFGFTLDTAYKERILTKSEKTLLYMKGKQEKALSDIEEELFFVSNLGSVGNFENEQTRATDDLYHFIKTKRGFDQIRILDLSGQEVICVNAAANPSVVDFMLLQDSRDQEVFRQAKLLQIGEYYNSALQLSKRLVTSKEQGKPVVSFATSIYRGDSRVGYLIINYEILHSLDNYDLIVSNGNRFDLLDDQGISLGSLVNANPKNFSPFTVKTQGSSKKNTKQQIKVSQDDNYQYLAVQMDGKKNVSRNSNRLKQSEQSNRAFTLIHATPSEKFKAVKADYFWILIVSFILFSALYWFGYISLWSNRKQQQSSELKLNSIFNKSLSFVGLLAPDGTILEVNEPALQFAGITKEQVIGLKYWDAPWWALSSQARLNLRSAIQEASSGKSIRYDAEIVGDNDERIIIDFSLQPVRDENSEIIYIIPEGRNITEKVTLQKEIEANNQLHKAVQKLSNTGIWSVNLTDNRLVWDEIVYAIHELEFGTELKVEEGINFYREDFRELVRSSIDNAVVNNESWDIEAVLVTSKGKEVWVRALGYPVFKNGELLELRGTFADINTRKRNEEKLTENEKRLRLALDSTNLGMWDWNLVNDVLTWDDSLYEMYGLEQSEFTGAFEAWKSSVHPDDIENARDKVNESIDQRTPLNIIFRIIRQSGETRYLRADASVITDDLGKPIRMIGVNKDITESVYNERKIRELNSNLEDKVMERTAELSKTKVELEQQLSLLGVTAMVSETNLKGDIINANNAFCELCEYSKEELIGQTHRLLKSEIQDNGMYNDLWKTISGGGTWQGELCNKKKSGDLYWVHATIQPFLNEDNSITRYVGVYFDITQLKESTRKLSEMNAELDSANRELETFSYSVSHDLKAPLRALQGFSKNMIERYGSTLDETGTRWLHFIEDNASRMDNLIGDILSYSKIGKATIRKSKYSMKTLVQEKLAAIETGYKNQPTVTIEENLPDISSDRTMVGVIWQNLIDNAFKYSQKKENTEISIRAEVDRSGVTYFVKDTENGFDMRHYQKLFGVFQRLHSQQEFEGTGVGLANVQRIINKHNGTISAVGELGEGATFQFFLPF